MRHFGDVARLRGCAGAEVTWRARMHHAHKCASTHWIPWPKIVLATRRKHHWADYLFLGIKDVTTSEGLLDIRLTFSSPAAYFFRAGVSTGDPRPTLGAVAC